MKAPRSGGSCTWPSCLSSFSIHALRWNELGFTFVEHGATREDQFNAGFVDDFQALRIFSGVSAAVNIFSSQMLSWWVFATSKHPKPSNTPSILTTNRCPVRGTLNSPAPALKTHSDGHNDIFEILHPALTANIAIARSPALKTGMVDHRPQDAIAKILDMTEGQLCEGMTDGSL